MRVVPIGNLLMRGVGSLVMLILFLWFKPPVGLPRRQRRATRSSTPISSSIASILLAGMPLAGLVYRVSERIVALGTPPEPADALAVTELSARSTRARSTRPPRRSPTRRARWCGSARPSRSC